MTVLAPAVDTSNPEGLLKVYFIPARQNANVALMKDELSSFSWPSWAAATQVGWGEHPLVQRPREPTARPESPPPAVFGAGHDHSYPTL